MKKRTILILTLISIVAMVAGTAMSNHGSNSIRFAGARFIGGKGAVFLFDYTGTISKSDLQAAFAYGNGGDPLKVHCVDKKEMMQIRCTVSGVNRYTDITLNIAGQSGGVLSVPKPKSASIPCLGFEVSEARHDSNLGAWSWEEVTNYGGHGSASAFFTYWEGEGHVFSNKCVTDASLFDA